MTDIPEGYMLWMIGGKQELITPEGELVPIAHDASLEQIVEAARTHKALNTTCQWDPGCPVCEDRRRRALVA